MRHADVPSGPNKPTREIADAATEQEELDELAADQSADGEPPTDPGQTARHAARAAHGGERDAATAGGNRNTGSGEGGGGGGTGGGGG